MASGLAAHMGRLQIDVKKTGVTVTIPSDPIAKLMYYFDCVCACVEPDSSDMIRRLRDYKSYYLLTSEERAQLLVLVLALSPDKLIGSIFHPSNDGDSTNEFLELTAVKTDLVVTDSVLIGGQRRQIRKIMTFKKVWMERYYLEPLQEIQRSSSRPQLRAPPPRRRSDDSCTIL